MSLKLWDFECTECQHISRDVIVESGVYETDCRKCGKKAERIFTPSGCFIGNQDADWIRSVTEVVDKDNPAPHVQRFLKNPNRRNYKAWMKGEGLRPTEIGISQHGEEYDSRQERKHLDEGHERHMTEAVARKRFKDRSIEIY